MKTILQSIRRNASALLVAAVVASCAMALNSPLADIPGRVEAAHSRSDHEALNAYYKAQAVDARAKVSEHRRRATSYGDLSKGGASPRMAAHCDSIAWLYEEIALEYDGMAQYHELLAKEPAMTKPWTAPRAPSHEREESDMKRRIFLRGSGGFAALAALPTLAAERAKSSV